MFPSTPISSQIYLHFSTVCKPLASTEISFSALSFASIHCLASFPWMHHLYLVCWSPISWNIFLCPLAGRKLLSLPMCADCQVYWSKPREDLGLVHIRALAIPECYRKCELHKSQSPAFGKEEQRKVGFPERDEAYCTGHHQQLSYTGELNYSCLFFLLLPFVCLSLPFCLLRYPTDICIILPQLSFVQHFLPRTGVHLNCIISMLKSCGWLKKTIMAAEWNLMERIAETSFVYRLCNKDRNWTECG